uniref:Uncharacterized protein n=1 Tax=Prymnesium polylepis TaxID=72548 RepID=A0A7S4HD66_9EUKA|mmetsp:Transcript_11779/g.29531  ORF Transcript_11779/g.29531 Transcript_11779/m.29531 type:complete len:120 (+) Transcript_11779:177-536(+)
MYGCTGLANESGTDDSFLRAYGRALARNAEVTARVLSQLRGQGRRIEMSEVVYRLNRHQQIEAISMYKMIAAHRLLKSDPTKPGGASAAQPRKARQASGDRGRGQPHHARSMRIYAPPA